MKLRVRKTQETQPEEIHLQPHATSAKRARQFVTERLAAVGYPTAADDAQTIVSELVTNSLAALLKTPDEHRAPIKVWVGLTGGKPALEVWDNAEGDLRLQVPDFESECGRGLLIVRALAESVTWIPTLAGKGVSVMLRVPDPS